MHCSCGSSRFEAYRLELKRLVLNWLPVDQGKTVTHVVEHERVIETARPIVIRCIKCGSEGPPEDFDYSQKDRNFMKPERREGHTLPEGLSPLSRAYWK